MDRAEQKQFRDFAEKCRKAGLKATHQRMEIMRELFGEPGHPDAETIFRRVRSRMPAISLETVYRTLRLFEDRGLIGRVGMNPGRTRFDANTSRHNHFVCTECGRICDLDGYTLPVMQQPSEVDGVGWVNSVYIELRGRCHDCQYNAGKPVPRG